jgi:hypothetical protein
MTRDKDREHQFFEGQYSKIILVTFILTSLKEFFRNNDTRGNVIALETTMGKKILTCALKNSNSLLSSGIIGTCGLLTRETNFNSGCII